MKSRIYRALKHGYNLDELVASLRIIIIYRALKHIMSCGLSNNRLRIIIIYRALKLSIERW